MTNFCFVSVYKTPLTYPNALQQNNLVTVCIPVLQTQNTITLFNTPSLQKKVHMALLFPSPKCDVSLIARMPEWLFGNLFTEFFS